MHSWISSVFNTIRCNYLNFASVEYEEMSLSHYTIPFSIVNSTTYTCIYVCEDFYLFLLNHLHMYASLFTATTNFRLASYWNIFFCGSLFLPYMVPFVCILFSICFDWVTQPRCVRCFTLFTCNIFMSSVSQCNIYALCCDFNQDTSIQGHI